MSASTSTLLQARLSLVLAAVLWSTGGLFIRLFQEPSRVQLHQPVLEPLQIAFYRSFFAGLSLLFLVRPSQIHFRLPMLALVMFFGVMTALYISALAFGPAANAIFLQNTAPIWVYIVGVGLLGHAGDPRSFRSILLAMLGAVVIVAGNWPRGLAPEQQSMQIKILLMGIGSGMSYAMVILLLSRLRSEAPAWLTSLNLLGSALVIGLFVLQEKGPQETLAWLMAPSSWQFVCLALFGFIQLALPYLLFARGLQTIPPQEAGLITLLEPVLMPIWAYLITPARDTPSIWTLMGGSLLLLALLWRYLPIRIVVEASPIVVEASPPVPDNTDTGPVNR